MPLSVTDATLFAAGALFTQDYLEEGIAQSRQWAVVDAVAVRAQLEAIHGKFKAIVSFANTLNRGG